MVLSALERRAFGTGAESERKKVKARFCVFWVYGLGVAIAFGKISGILRNHSHPPKAGSRLATGLAIATCLTSTVGIEQSLGLNVVRPIFRFLAKGVARVFRVVDPLVRHSAHLCWRMIWRVIFPILQFFRKCMVTAMRLIRATWTQVVRFYKWIIFRVLSPMCRWTNDRVIQPFLRSISWTASVITAAVRKAGVFVTQYVLHPLLRLIRLLLRVCRGILVSVIQKMTSVVRFLWLNIFKPFMVVPIQWIFDIVAQMLKFSLRYGRDWLVFIAGKMIRTMHFLWINCGRKLVIYAWFHVIAPAIRYVHPFIWPVITLTMSVKFGHGAVASRNGVGCGAFVAGSISMATASLCLIGRALSSTSPALYGYGARLVRIGVFLTMVQDLFLINGIHLTLRLIFRLSQTLFRLIVDFSNALYRVALRGVEAVTKMAKKVFIAVRSVVIWVFRVVFKAVKFIWSRPFLSFVVSGVFLSLLYSAFTGAIEVPSVAGYLPHIRLNRSTLRNLVKAALAMTKNALSKTYERLHLRQAYASAAPAAQGLYKSANAFYSMEALSHLDDPYFAATCYLVTTSLSKLTLLVFPDPVGLQTLIPMSLGVTTKSILLPVLAIGSISRFGGSLAVKITSFLAFPLSLCFVGLTVLVFGREIRQRRSLVRRLAALRPNFIQRRQQNLRLGRPAQHESNQALRARMDAKLRKLKPPARVFTVDDCAICLESIVPKPKLGTTASVNDGKHVLKSAGLQKRAPDKKSGTKDQEIEGQEKAADGIVADGIVADAEEREDRFATPDDGKSDTTIVEQSVGFALPCGHYFHRACIARWLWRNQRCPFCRADVYSDAAGYLM